MTKIYTIEVQPKFGYGFRTAQGALDMHTRNLEECFYSEDDALLVARRVEEKFDKTVTCFVNEYDLCTMDEYLERYKGE